MKSITVVLAIGLALATTGLAACGGGGGGGTEKAAKGTTLAPIKRDAANTGKTVTIGSKNFTEEFILGQIYAQALRKAGYTVKTQLNLGSEQIANRAVKSGQVDAYPEYTTTALTSFFNVKIAAVPKSSQQAYQQAKADYAKVGLTALSPTPYRNDEAVGMTKKEASKLGVKTISDLKPKASKIVFAGPPECKQRVDCLLGLERTYGLRFKKFVPVDPAQRYKTADSGQAQMIVVFTTDGALASGKYVVLKDDKHLFPPYNATLVARNQALKKLGPDFQKVVSQVQKGLTTPAMQELNSRVDVDKQDPKAVAAQYLRETGLAK
jgi:glycine betaine/choline ABC-type transport system substrate-binding protein